MRRMREPEKQLKKNQVECVHILTFFHFRGRCRIQPTFYSTAPCEGVPWSSSCWLNDRLELNNDNEKERIKKYAYMNQTWTATKNLFEYYYYYYGHSPVKGVRFSSYLSSSFFHSAAIHWLRLIKNHNHRKSTVHASLNFSPCARLAMRASSYSAEYQFKYAKINN